MLVVPAVSPLTTPLVLTVPTAVLLLLHVPPAVAFASAVELPAHTLAVPVIGVTAFTVTVALTLQLPTV